MIGADCCCLQWLIWDLERHHKATLPVRLFEEISAISVNDTVEIFEWISATCRYLDLGQSVEKFAMMNREQCGGLNVGSDVVHRACNDSDSSNDDDNDMRIHDHNENNNQNSDKNNLHQDTKHNYLHQYNHDNHRLKTRSIVIDRIGLAGTSRMRGLYYSLLSVCNVSNGENLCRGAIDFIDRDVNIEYQSRRMEVSFMSEACNAALDYVFVTGRPSFYQAC